MNKLLILMLAGALAGAGSAMAADAPAAKPATAAPATKTATAAPAAKTATAAPAANSQQNKMKTCNEQAGDKKGDERKAFMKTCLSAAPVKAESKMAMCNKKTAGLAKEARAKAQSECMKAPS